MFLFVRAQDVAKDLGVLWDSQMTTTNQIANMCKISILYLRSIMKIRKYLSTTAQSPFVYDQQI